MAPHKMLPHSGRLQTFNSTTICEYRELVIFGLLIQPDNVNWVAPTVVSRQQCYDGFRPCVLNQSSHLLHILTVLPVEAVFLFSH